MIPHSDYNHLVSFFFFAQKSCGPTTEATLECAKRHIDSMIMVGIMEEFDTTLQLLLWLTGMQDFTPDQHHVNVAPRGSHKHRLTPEERREVEIALRFDIELYEFARKRFANDVRAMEMAIVR